MSDTLNTQDTHVQHNTDVQHGIDGNPNYDAVKGAGLGGLAGAAVGAAAGSMAGPVGTVAGAFIGGVVGAVGSGVAVLAVDQVDNDNTVSGISAGATPEIESPAKDATSTI